MPSFVKKYSMKQFIVYCIDCKENGVMGGGGSFKERGGA